MKMTEGLFVTNITFTTPQSAYADSSPCTGAPLCAVNLFFVAKRHIPSVIRSPLSVVRCTLSVVRLGAVPYGCRLVFTKRK